MKLIIKIFLPFIIFLFIYNTVEAQENLINAKVHFKDGTTVIGNVFFFDFNFDEFSVETETKEKTSYKIENTDFIETPSSILRNYNYDNKAKLFEAIVEGEKMSLYKTIRLEKELYYIYKANKMYLLEGGKVKVTKDLKKYTKENTRYKGTLKVLLDTNQYLVDQVDLIKYNAKDLSEIVVKYNEGRISFLSPKKTSKEIISISAFIQYSNIVSNLKFN